MRLAKKANLSQEQTDKEQLARQVVTDKPKKKRQIFSFWGVATILGIFGTLGFISLPNLLSCGNKGKEAEGKTNIGSMNRAQQANFEEKKAFANSVEAVGIGINAQTVNYNYSIQTKKTASFQYGTSRKENIKSYVGGVFIVPANTTNKSEMTTASIVCGALKPGLTKPTPPTLVKNVPTCGDGTKDLTTRYNS